MHDFFLKYRHSVVSFHLLLVALAVSLGAFVAHYNQERVVATMYAQLDAQRAILYELALITDRNDADEVISKIINDCPRRAEFESLLNQLGTLSKKELVTVQNLYESCGGFYAERKALMVSRLVRELDVAKQLYALLVLVDGTVPEAYQLEVWESLTQLEQSRSELLTNQSEIQSRIITLLISGHTVGSSDVRTLVDEAQDIAEILNVRNHEIDKLHGQLKD